jgi:hypothetical protein
MGIATQEKKHRTGHGLVPVSQVEQIGNFLRHPCRQCFDTHPLYSFVIGPLFFLTLRLFFLTNLLFILFITSP